MVLHGQIDGRYIDEMRRRAAPSRYMFIFAAIVLIALILINCLPVEKARNTRRALPSSHF